MFQKLKEYCWFRPAVTLVLAAFIAAVPGQSAGYAQVAALMPLPGEMVSSSERFCPAHMVGLRVDSRDPFNFFFVMHKGQQEMSFELKKEEYNRLIKYFLASLTTPDDDMWVNLSPYESGRIMPDNLAETAMGKDLLAQDYLLKQLTSSLMYPEGESGREFWGKVYARAAQELGTTDIPLDTFNKVWIAPDKAEIYQKGDTVFLVNSHLKVMLEQDLFAGKESAQQHSRQLSTEVLRDVIIPVIEREVNTGKNFALLRQIYGSMILAVWFKRALKDSLLGQVYADQSKVSGIEGNDPQAREKIYRQYMEAYKTGVYDYIKEDFDPATHQLVPRRYFSGGMVMDAAALTVAPETEARRVIGQEAGFYDAAAVTLLQTLRAGAMALALGLGTLSPVFAAQLSSTGHLDEMEAKAFAYLDAHPARKAELRRAWQDGSSVEKISSGVPPKKSAGAHPVIKYGQSSVPVFSGSFDQAFRQGARAGQTVDGVKLFGWKGKVYAVRYAGDPEYSKERTIPSRDSSPASIQQTLDAVQRLETLALDQQAEAQWIAARRIGITVPASWQEMENFRVGAEKALFRARRNPEGVDVPAVEAQIRQTLERVAEWQDKNEVNPRISSADWRLAGFYSSQLSRLLQDWQSLAPVFVQTQPVVSKPQEPSSAKQSVGETGKVWPLWTAVAALFAWLAASIWKRKARESRQEQVQERIPPVMPSLDDQPVSVEEPEVEPEPVLRAPQMPQATPAEDSDQPQERNPEANFIFSRSALQITLERYNRAIGLVAPDLRPALQTTHDRLQIWMKAMEEVSLPPALAFDDDRLVAEHMQNIMDLLKQKEEVVAGLDALQSSSQFSPDEKEEQQRELMGRLESLDDRYDQEAVLLAAVYLRYFHLPQDDAGIPPPASLDQAQDPVGGISLNEKYLKIDIRVDGEGMPLPANMQDPVMLDLQGLTPVIFRIEPLNAGNVPVLAELAAFPLVH